MSDDKLSVVDRERLCGQLVYEIEYAINRFRNENGVSGTISANSAAVARVVKNSIEDLYE